MTATARHALRRFDTELARHGVPVVDRPPASEDAVRDAIEVLGLNPVDDAVTWWAWVGTPPPDEGWSRFVTPRHRLITFDRAVSEYRDFVAPPPESGLLADRGWLPLAKFAHGGLVVADCSPNGDGTVRSWNADAGVGGRGVSVGTAVGWWTEHLASGAWAWDGAAWHDRLENTSLPDDQRYSLLV